jgi:methyl-accepting chemotaxis protein
MLATIQFDSIKTRLIIIIAVCLLGMLVLVGNQIYNTDRLINLNSQSKQLLNLSHELLQLRRHEKDFLLRLDPQYVDKFRIRADGFSQQITQLNPIFAKLGDTDTLFDELSLSFNQYRSQFFSLVSLQTQIGLDENSGFQGRFRQATHSLEEQLQRLNQTDLQVLMLQMRRSEKDFLLRKNLDYVERETLFYQQLSLAITQSNQLNVQQQPLLDIYQHSFLQLVSAYQTIGLDHTLGLQGQFREQAHVLEEQLTRVNNKLAVLINVAEVRVERISLLIMTITTLVLVTLLIKSYITFQRAFLNFVMFFYRCKREYQHMDGKKLGFSEFKYLATIANEMIDARCDIERQLQAANKHIAELEKVNNDSVKAQ